MASMVDENTDDPAARVESSSAAEDPSEESGSSSSRRMRIARIVLPIAVGIAVLAAVVTVTLVTPAAPPGSEGSAPADLGVAEVGARAPDFELTTIDGKKFKLSEQRGKTVLVNFWGTWCPPCEREMPELVASYNQSGGADGGRAFVAVAVNDVEESVRKFVTQKKINFPVGTDEGVIAGHYLVSAFPTTVIIDANGIVRERISRAFPNVDAVNAALTRAELTQTAGPG